MASYLISECLEIIFLNLTEYPSNYIKTNVSTKDLYSCTLVSRHWCKISTPLLYAFPFHHFRNNISHSQYYKLIRTLLTCAPQFEIKRTYKQVLLQIPKKNFKKNPKSNILSTFNYIAFIRGLIFHKMMFETELLYDNSNKEIWLFDYDLNRISIETAIAIMNHLIKFILNSISQFITSQKKLQHFILSGIEEFEDMIQNLNFMVYRFLMDLIFNATNYFNILIHSLSTQSETLQILEFRYLADNLINGEVLDSLILLKNIRVLKFYKCENIDNLHTWIKNLKKLEIFEITVELPKIFLSELIPIFKSCNKLIYISVILINNELQDEDLEILGDFVPKTLKRFKLKGIQSKLSMNLFLEAYIKNGGTLKYLELEYLNVFSKNHINVNEQFGVQIIDTKYSLKLLSGSLTFAIHSLGGPRLVLLRTNSGPGLSGPWVWTTYLLILEWVLLFFIFIMDFGQVWIYI
ncbi:hypothetical protein GLOIN_2v1875106 [Rhizophagus irregularis DAOM 181602=DAOM 197198]|nr:hypothetical protein GLOIN_2v1875106 [Rhizophagus irregularis DAOM 181602=DAOM 197198]